MIQTARLLSNRHSLSCLIAMCPFVLDWFKLRMSDLRSAGEFLKPIFTKELVHEAMMRDLLVTGTVVTLIPSHIQASGSCIP